MVGFIDAAKDFLKGKVCEALDSIGDAYTLAAEATGGGLGAFNVANGLGALVCDLPPNNLPLPAPPFTGGQCGGVAYRVTITSEDFPFSDCSSFGPVATTNGFLGPIRGLVFDVVNPSGPLCTPGRNRARLSHGAPGNFTVVAGGGFGVNASINSVVREDGQLDNCGDPPPVFPTPGPGVDFGGDIIYNIDDSTQITVPVTGVFAPIFVSFDGSLRIPVNIDVGGVEFSGELTVSPEFTVNIRPKGITSGPGKPDDPDTGPGQPGVPVPEDEEDVDVIVGVLVFSTLTGDFNNATGFPSVGGPTLMVPRLGSVQFAVKSGNSIGWTSDLDVKNVECYVPCPAPQGAIAVRVTPIAGVTRTFTPVRGKPLT